MIVISIPLTLTPRKFAFLEAIDLEFVPEDAKNKGERIDLFDTLIQEFSALPTKPKELDYGNYAVVNVAPPVVPNPYLPSFRVFSYNSSAGENARTKGKKRRHGHKRGDHGNKAAHCKLKENRDTWKCYLNESWYSDPKSPSRSNQLWSPLGYAQVCR